MDIFKNTELLSLIANLGALSVLGFLYAAYIKNLKTSLSLKDEQLATIEKRLDMWRDKASEMERKTPEYIEKVLAERIRIREDELLRIKEDGKKNAVEIEARNTEILKLQNELNAAHDLGQAISVYDSSIEDFRIIHSRELERKKLGNIWVDTATVFIGDPFHFRVSREVELEEYSAPKGAIWFKVKSDDEVYFVRTMDEKLNFENFETAQTLTQLLEHEVVELISSPSSFPVDPSSYIKGDNFSYVERPGKSKECTFYNGLRGAGVAIGLLGDGDYPVHAEYFDGRIIRITIDC